MRALVKTEALPGHVSIQERPIPEPGVGEVRLRVKAAAVCGSDLQAYRYPSHYQDFMQGPVILGHEVAGIVDKLGPDVDVFQPGDRLMMESNLYCGVCHHCLSGDTTSCKNARIAGLHFDGGMADYVVIPARMLHRLPDGLSFRHATIAQPLSVVLHGVVDRIQLPVAGTVVVIGPGIIGNLAAQVVAALGARRVVVIGIDADERVRLPLARELGFVTANFHRDDLQALLSSYGAEYGVELVVECSGAPTTSARGVELLDKGGQLLLLGISKEPESMPMHDIVRREISVVGSYTSGWNNYEQALALMANDKICVDPLLADYPLDEGVTAFKRALDLCVMKPVLVP